nr:SRPBCC family protein [uncultured Gellertiella sp.]
MPTLAAHIIHLSIERSWQEVYAYASRPENMPEWASGLSATMRRDGDDYIADGGPVGATRIRFAPENSFGVIDHTVTLENGVSIFNALRVVPNGRGAEVMFTLLQTEGMDGEAFERDAAHVLKDLKALKSILETGRAAASY